MLAHLVPCPIQVNQLDPKVSNDNSSSSPPPKELKPLPSHLKYAYLDEEQQLPVIIASNLHQEQEDKLLFILRQHKKEIGWKLSDLPWINPSIYMHRILMEEEARPIRQQQRRMNPTILDVVKKEVTKLLAIGIIYPIDKLSIDSSRPLAELLSTEAKPICSISPTPVQFPHSRSQSISASGILMTIAKGSSIAIPRNYAIATSSVGRD
ncbi:hypothetical protein CR513_45382, partial [Mucuna pruriens]